MYLWRTIGLLVGLGAASALASCGDEDDDDSPNSTPGSLQGSLSVFTPGVSRTGPTSSEWSSRAARVFEAVRTKQPSSTAKNSARGPEVSAPAIPLPSIDIGNRLSQLNSGRFVPGEVMVTFRSKKLFDVRELGARQRLQNYRFSLGVFGGPKVATIRFRDVRSPDRQITSEETRKVRTELAAAGVFAHVEFNHYKWAFAEPNDESYPNQWHYPQINLPAAWDITTGSADVVVAVIDDGINAHPDLDRVVAGYDMISDPTIAGDGDGRDARPEQVRLSHGTTSVWHGTHVAGTVGASSNNGSGAAGVDWRARLLPIRVLGRVVPGRGQGTSIDIIAGINWAAGIDVPGVPSNPTPAQVMNLSLGGGALIQAEQDAINAAVARGTAVVVAAGNENVDASGTSLAGYDNVIVVGATDYEGRRAPYSNFGSVIDVMAPGGNMRADANADGRPDGVLSTYLDENGQRSIFQFLQGTSMAAPHVAGLAALMKAVNPQITPAQIEQQLKSTANSAKRCSEGCGAGLVNAAAAVLGARGGGDPQQPASLTLSTPRLNLGTRESGSLQIFNGGGGQLSWTARFAGPQGTRLSLEGASQGTVGAGGAETLTVRANRADLADGEYQGQLVVQAGTQQQQAAVLFRVGASPVQDVGTVIVAAVGFDEADEVVVAGAGQTSLSNNYRFTLEADPGEWLVLALADRNNNDELDAGDYWGLYRSLDAPESVRVEPGGRIDNLSLNLVPFAGEEEVSAPPCREYRSCIEACGGNSACGDQCPISQECQGCFDSQVVACGTAAGCAGNDINCLCGQCEPALDSCFGPLLCSGARPNSPAPVGGSCDGSATQCQGPYQCDISVPGGYCTRSCFIDGTCPGGLCVEVDLNQDGVVDDAFCFATCTGPGTCPRGSDSCVDVGVIEGACVP